jgi:8-oxo-dGTP diphosphatase
MASRDGNGWVRCALGHRHWGRYGAAGLLAYVADGPVLLQRRTWWSHHGGTWGLPGGARDSHESAVAAALREAAEECGVPADAVRQRGAFLDDHGGWSYTSVLAEADAPFPVQSDDDETDEAAWVDLPEVSALNLHPGLAAHWAELREELAPVTIIVDGANVVGSRPDGWWRDRAGAALRLRDQLARLVTEGITELPYGLEPLAEARAMANDWLTGTGTDGGGGSGRPLRGIAGMADAEIQMRWMPDVVLVVEGAAKPAAAQADATPVQVVAAAGSGDDTIAALAGKTAGRRFVVTADRELRRRCLAAGASVAGPGWLLGLL